MNQTSVLFLIHPLLSIQIFLSIGITTATDLAYDGLINDALSNWALLTKNRMRLYLYNLPQSSPSQSTCCRLTLPSNSTTTERDTVKILDEDFVKIAGVKLYADGSPHSGTMAVEQEFLTNELTETLGFYIPPRKGRLIHITKNRYGELNKDSPCLDSLVKEFHKDKKQIAIHCHGDRACEQVLSVFEDLDAHSVRNQRHRMEHLGLISERQIERASKLGICLSFNVAILYYYAPVFEKKIFGPDKTKKWTPCKHAVEKNAIWTLHQDHPPHPGPILPFLSMKAALTRTALHGGEKVYGKEYRVPKIHDVLKDHFNDCDGLKYCCGPLSLVCDSFYVNMEYNSKLEPAYTVNAAYTMNAEKKMGCLKEGYFADLVVLNQNPYNFESNKEDFDKIEVVWTSVGGDNIKKFEDRS